MTASEPLSWATGAGARHCPLGLPRSRASLHRAYRAADRVPRARCYR